MGERRDEGTAEAVGGGCAARVPVYSVCVCVCVCVCGFVCMNVHTSQVCVHEFRQRCSSRSYLVVCDYVYVCVCVCVWVWV